MRMRLSRIAAAMPLRAVGEGRPPLPTIGRGIAQIFVIYDGRTVFLNFAGLLDRSEPLRAEAAGNGPGPRLEARRREMSKVQFAVVAALILGIGTLALAPVANAQPYGGTTVHQQSQENQ